MSTAPFHPFSFKKSRRGFKIDFMNNHKKALLAYSSILIIIIYCCSSILWAGANKNKENKEQKKVGILYMTMNNPYFQVINKEIIAYVEDKGDKVITRDSGLDAERQIRQVESFIEEDVDIILLNAVDWKSILPALKNARNAGIPVLAVDTQVYDENYVAGTILSDNYGAGKLLAYDLMKRRSGGNILLLEHKTNKSSQDRIQGFLEALDQAKWSYTIVDELETYGQLEIAEPEVEKLLDQGVQIDVVMALNDPAALGAMAALDSKGELSDVVVYGIDGAPEAKNMISNGLMTATVAQSPTKTGKIAARYLYDVLDGKEIPKKEVLSVTLISQKNIMDYSLNSWE